MDFQVRTSQTALGALCITVVGDIDMATTAELDDVVAAALLDDRVKAVQVDLAEATFLDSVGISTLLRGMNLAAERQKDYRVMNARNRVEHVLKLTGLLHILDDRDGGRATR